MNVLGSTHHGGYETLEIISLPLPPFDPETQPNDVLIEVAFSDVNPVDLQKLKGPQPGSPVANPPFVPGYGGSGSIRRVGSNVPTNLKPGIPVCFLADPRKQGSYATHIVVDHRCVAALPEHVSLREAACIPVAGLTAYEALAKVGLSSKSSRPPKSLLVVGGAGGVGSWILTLARAWYPDFEILATASAPSQQDWCRSLGANRVMKHEEIGKQLGGGPKGSVQAIICLTEPTPSLFNTLAEVIQPYGNICLVVAGSSIKSLDLSFCFFKAASVSCQTVFSSIRTQYETIVPAQELSDILQLAGAKVPLSPDLTNGKVSESWKDDSDRIGVLKWMAEGTGRRGKYILSIEHIKSSS